MTVRSIVRWPDPRLAKVCAPVACITPQIEALAQDMLNTMYAAPGRGLAAPQIGVLLRVFVMDTMWKETAAQPRVFVNPVVLWRSAAQTQQQEGCLSIPGITVDVTRPAEVQLMWTGLDGRVHHESFEGFAAACVQHEVDHLDGTVTFDRLAAPERVQAQAAYREVRT